MSSSAQRVFVTGAAGYLGGNTVLRLLEKHPDANLALLVRDESQGKILSSYWPNVEIVQGSLDDVELMRREAAKSDVVLQTASADHAPSAIALIEGLAQHKPNPGYFIHVSGTGMLHDVSNGYGNLAERVYSDISELKEVTSLPIEGNIHRDVDAAVLAAHEATNVPVAIISPPTIHGVGKGPVKNRSLQIPFLTEAIIKRGKGFQVLEGQNMWSHVHIDDAADAFIVLVEEALKPNGGNAQWGDEGYYFIEAGDFKWGDVAAAISKQLSAKGAIPTAEVDKVPVEDASAYHPWAPLLWGGNSRVRADRLRALGWGPKHLDILASVPEMVAQEIKKA
ncbi:hypothetical protein BP5796_02739 [Coleophoma crateriformis]|uniref:NAD(P)-binding domain-containing protein n=1 Tax=Coleophoma crateriformis TaxID=565419 RepID=A0A3D8SZ56_9HELO|nr:hypothetical protein BP5796_02739 [Coleophoma crateriformis]